SSRPPPSPPQASSSSSLPYAVEPFWQLTSWLSPSPQAIFASLSALSKSVTSSLSSSLLLDPVEEEEEEPEEEREDSLSTFLGLKKYLLPPLLVFDITISTSSS